MQMHRLCILELITMKSFVIIPSLVIFSGFVRTDTFLSKWYRDTSLDNKTYYDGHGLTFRTLIHCVYACAANATCKSVFFVQDKKQQGNCLLQSTVLSPGLSSLVDEQGSIYYIKENGALDGRTFTIICVENQKWWHYDGSANIDFVSSLWQPHDEFIKFRFEHQTDGSYKIWSVGGGVYLFDGYGVAGAVLDILNGKSHLDDDHARFIVSRVDGGSYRIQTKATHRFLRLDEDLKVSSKKNVEDERALFLIEA